MAFVGYQDWTYPREGPVYANWVHGSAYIYDQPNFTWYPFTASGLEGPVRINQMEILLTKILTTPRLDQSSIGITIGGEGWFSVKFSMIDGGPKINDSHSFVNITQKDVKHSRYRAVFSPGFVSEGGLIISVTAHDAWSQVGNIAIFCRYDIYYGGD